MAQRPDICERRRGQILAHIQTLIHVQQAPSFWNDHNSTLYRLVQGGLRLCVSMAATNAMGSRAPQVVIAIETDLTTFPRRLGKTFHDLVILAISFLSGKYLPAPLFHNYTQF